MTDTVQAKTEKGKKKWSKGKVKERSQNAVLPEKALVERMNKEVPGFRFVSVSVLVDRFKINGSLARVALRDLESRGIIKPVELHQAQRIYTRAGGAE